MAIHNWGTLMEPWRFWRSCQVKRPYYLPQEADRAAAEARKRSGDDIERYKCDFCAWWHIGHRRDK